MVAEDNKVGPPSVYNEKKLTALIRERFAAVGKRTRVVAVELDGARFWAKRLVASKARGWHLLQRCLSLLIPLKILRTTVPSGAGSELLEEYRRLVQFQEAGIPVPAVLGFYGDYFVTVDGGLSLEQAMNTAPIGEERSVLLHRAAGALAALHNAGLCHGRPYLRDMLVTASGDIGFLDLEENPLRVMPLAIAQARDFWVFVSSASEWLPDDGGGHQEFIVAYLERAPREVRRELSFLMRRIGPLSRLLQRLPIRLGRDLRKALAAGIFLQLALVADHHRHP